MEDIECFILGIIIAGLLIGIIFIIAFKGSVMVNRNNLDKVCSLLTRENAEYLEDINYGLDPDDEDNFLCETETKVYDFTSIKEKKKTDEGVKDYIRW